MAQRTTGERLGQRAFPVVPMTLRLDREPPTAWCAMKNAIAWSAARTGLYLVFIVSGIVGGGLLYDGVHGHIGLSYFGHALEHPDSWLPQVVRAAAILGLYTLLLLAALSAVRQKLSNVALKMILLPFLLLPVALIDLAGTTPPFTLGFLVVQLLYVFAVRMNPARASQAA